jgi:hypothetical protein
MGGERNAVFADEMPPLDFSDDVRRSTLSLNARLLKYTDSEVDDFLVEFCTKQMKDKMAVSRGKGRGGWHTQRCSTESLRKMLQEHIEKGDMVDVMNIAGMILVREQIGYTD